MEKLSPRQHDYLGAFIKSAQYLAGLTIQQDIWHESAKVLVNFFGADLCAFAKGRANGEIETHYWTSSNQNFGQEDLGSEMKEEIEGVLETCFLTSQLFFIPDPLSVAFLPITQRNRVTDVMVVGHITDEPIPKELLNIYLAVSRLVGTTAERLASEIELRRHRDHLDELVKDRTGELTKANEQLQQEITERRRAENKLRESEAEKKAILHGMTTNVRLVNRNREIVWVNKAGLASIDKALEEVIGRKCFEFWGDDPTTPCPDCPAAEIFKYRRPVQAIKHLQNGKVLDFRSEPVFDNNGNMVGVVELTDDITYKLQLEEQLRQAQRMESIATLTGGIAHDYNNLMSIIMANLSMAMEEAEPGSQLADFLNGANMASHKVRDLTHELMTLSRGGAPVKEIGSLTSLLASATDIIKGDSGISVRKIISKDLRRVPHDQYQMGVVFRNLLTNAAEAMPQGGIITIMAENLRIDGGPQNPRLPLKTGDYVRISIQDQGKGIREEHLEKIFDPYFSTKAMGAQKGMGLGLATAYAIVQKHGGYIAVSSSPGAGAIVDIYLPTESRQAESGIKTPPPEDSASSKKRVLVMDDEDALRNLAEKMLEKLGYATETVKDGVEATESYQKGKDSGEPFDAVMLDLTIKGGMGGEQTIRDLLKIDPHVKAIVCSGYFNDPVMADFQKYGFKGALQKPYEKNALKEVLERLSL